MKVKIECPYCNFESSYKINENDYGKQLIICDMEEGGCDRTFVIEARVRVEVETFKIEGEE